MQIQCPSCSKILEVDDASAGQVVACPGCGGQMQVPAASGPAQHIAVEPLAAPPQAGPAAGGQRPCPYCGEGILAGAVKCRHCRTYLSGPMAGKSDSPKGGASADSGQGTKSIIFGVLGFVICAPIFSSLAIYQGLQARNAGDSKGTVGLVLGIIGWVLMILAVLVQVLAAASQS